MATTLAGNGLGNVESITAVKNANIELSPLSRKDSSSTKLFDFNGATRTISVSGSYTDTTIANVKTNFVDVINAILDGFQSSTSAFSSSITGSVNVLVNSFEYTWDVNSTQVGVNYSLELIEGTLGGQ